MRETLLVFSLVALPMLLCTTEAASAKSPTVKISISGGGLTRVIEITDPQILALSNIWSATFLDLSRSPENHAPQGVYPYELWFYAKLAENDVRKMYVGFYYPNSSIEQGLIYLPDQEPVWSLNSSAILRKRLDGKWNYVSPKWESLIQPLIARAEAQQNSGAEAKEFPNSPRIIVDGWTKPHSGWLYILDPRSESERPGSRVWLFDPETQKVMGSVRAGYQPDFALSPDGRHLYVVSGERESGELAAIDTATGAIEHFPFPERILYKPWYEGLPPFSPMAVSSDGRALHILGHQVFSPDEIGYQGYQLWTFDTQSGHFQNARLDLGGCGYGHWAPEFVPSSTAAEQFDFLCPEIINLRVMTNSLRFIQLDAKHHEASNISVKLPWPERCDAAQVLLSSNRNKVAIVRRDGAIFEMDTTTQRFSPTQVTGDCRDPQIFFPIPSPSSPDGRNSYIGYGTLSGDNMSTSSELRMFDTTTWQQLARFTTSVPFWSAATSNDGRLVYAPAPKQHSVLVIDIATTKEKQPIRVGETPSLALVAP